MKRITGLAIVAFLMVVLGGPAAHAAPPEKVPVCHFDADAGVHVRIEVPDQAARRHLERHADGVVGEGFDDQCRPVVAQPPAEPEPPAEAGVLARAHAIDQVTGAEVVVAEWVDSNLDAIPSAGDTVRTSRHPTTATFVEFGAFGVTEHAIVGDVRLEGDGGPGVSLTGRSAGGVFTFREFWSSGSGSLGSDVYLEERLDGAGLTEIAYHRVGLVFVSLNLFGVSPSEPVTVPASVGSPAGQVFVVDVVPTP